MPAVLEPAASAPPSLALPCRRSAIPRQVARRLKPSFPWGAMPAGQWADGGGGGDGRLGRTSAEAERAVSPVAWVEPAGRTRSGTGAGTPSPRATGNLPAPPPTHRREPSDLTRACF